MVVTYYRRRCLISTGVFFGCGLLYLVVRWITKGQEWGADIVILIPMGASLVYALWCGVRELAGMRERARRSGPAHPGA